MIAGKLVKGMGGEMDLVAGARRVIIAMEHNAKGGEHKIVAACTLPLTGRRVVHRIVTEIAVLDVRPGKPLLLVEHAPGMTVEEIAKRTGAPIEASPALREMA